MPIQNILDQATNILSGKSKDLESTTTGTTGSAAGEAAGQWGLDQDKGMMDPTAYTGNVPGSQGYNPAQQQGFDILSGMNPGAITGAVGNMTPQQIQAMSRSGGPGAGYMNPYQDQMIGGLKKDYGKAMEMGANQIGQGAAGANAFGGTRHGVAEGVMGADAMDNFLKQASGIRSDSFNRAMDWQGQDYNRNIAIAQANNQANLGFGDLRRRTAVDQGMQDFGRSDRFNRMGQFDVGQQNMEDQFNYGEFNRMQNWKPNMMNQYMQGVSGTPWQQQTSSTQYGSGPSDLQNLIGTGLQAGAIAASTKATFLCIPEGTKIDTLDGSIPIEDIKPGMKVKGLYGGETEVLQAHHYKEDPEPVRFATVEFDNGAKVDLCDMHRINGKRTKDYKIGDKIRGNKITAIKWYNGVERSYDLLTTDGGYKIGNIPVDSMINEMASFVNELKKAA